MKKLVLVSLMVSLLVPSLAWAQEEVLPEAPPADQPAESPETTLFEPAPAEPPPPPPSPVASEAEAAAEAESETHWYDNLSAGVFIDTFYMADWNRPGSPVGWTTGAAGGVPHRAYDTANGFGLAFVGTDLAYEGEKVGAHISLRYGSGASRLIGSPNPENSILWQGYLTWSPLENLSFDMGQFGTIYGGEVAESWLDLNYTRGALYYLMQPFYHIGLRGTYSPSDALSLTFMVVNGTNLNGGFFGFGEDDNQSPHLGAQVGFTPSDNFGLYLGYYTGSGASGFGTDLGSTTDDDWEHFFDVVVNGTFGDLSLVVNADFYVHPDNEILPDTAFYWGISGAVGYAITEKFGIAARAEFLHNPDLFITDAYEWLVTATLTLDYKPVENLVIRLDNRFELAEQDIFVTNDGVSDTGFTTTLGVVAHYGM